MSVAVRLCGVPTGTFPKFGIHFREGTVSVNADATLADVAVKYGGRLMSTYIVNVLTGRKEYTQQQFPATTKVRDLPAHSVLNVAPPYKGVIQHNQYTSGRDQRLADGNYHEYIHHDRSIRDLRTMHDARCVLEVKDGGSWKTLHVPDESASVSTLPNGVRVHWF